MRSSLLAPLALLAGAVSTLACAGAPKPVATAPAASAPAAKAEKWKTVFADEFDGPEGALPDPARWGFDTCGQGWGNKEREYYTDSPKNAFQGGGMLHLVARKGGADKLSCWYGPCEYTSARIKTKGKFAFTYGRVSARIKIPKGQGIWPAFWMLGSNIDGRGWPNCGEIDVMEVIGREPRVAHGTIHGPGYSADKGPTALWSPAKGEVGDDFHVFALDWEQERLRFSVDGRLYSTRTLADIPEDESWVFNHDFFLLLNVAVGGGWPGDPDASTPFPAEMLVDWVRVEVRE
jgi:beta-glucanase (GH16 family)